MQKTGAEILCECLVREGVTTLFGYPGGAILPTYDALTQYPQLHHVLTRHEQGATHMADGYARAGGGVGVVLATSGPGATNLVTGIATAMMDSSPMVCITGQVPTAMIGSDAFQETDILGATLPLTKHSFLVTDVRDLEETVGEAFAIARGGRPGPVLIDLPKDVQTATADFDPHAERQPAAHRSAHFFDHEPDGSFERSLDAACRLIESAERPLILAGRGVLLAGASDLLQAFAEKTSVPVALTLLGKGALPEQHPLCLGMMGMHGNAATNLAIQEADLLIAFGMRFDDRVTGDLKTYAQSARKIHVDIDAAEIGKNVAVDVGIVGDLGQVLCELMPALLERRRSDWRARIASWHREAERRDVLHADSGGRLLAAHVIHDLWEHTGGDVVVVTDVGQHQMWEAQYFPHRRPNTLITSGGLGTMGFGVPAALGAKLAHPQEEVWAVVGDGGFQMTMAELATAVQERLAIKIAIVNNGYLGMVRQWQEMFYDSRYSQTPMLGPDFCALAEAFGVESRRVRRRHEIGAAVDAAQAAEDRPFLVEFVVESEECVYPMVPSGAALNEMIRRQAERPASVGAASVGAAGVGGRHA